MMSVAVLVSLFFLYSLISRRLEQTIVTAPIVFTAAGMLMFPALPAILKADVNAEVLFRLSETGLVLLLFTDASRTDLKYLSCNCWRNRFADPVNWKATQPRQDR